MTPNQFLISKDLTVENLTTTINTIVSRIHNKPVSEWKDYTLKRIYFDKKISISKIEKLLNGVAVNDSKNQYTNTIQLFYGSYDGMLGFNISEDCETIIELIDVDIDVDVEQQIPMFLEAWDKIKTL